jgi:hypothetical protein
MERKARGVKLDGSIYDCLFSPPKGKTEVVKKGSTLDDTLNLFPEYVPRYAHQAQRLAAKVNDLEGDIYKTCYNLWYFLVNYIAYTPDQPGIEQIRSTDRLWSDKIGDCDCYAFTISCVFYQLKINHKLRITQYKPKDGFQHIYVVVPHRGKEIIIDACLERFNVEVPYINKTEVEMDLNFLNGLDPDSIARNGGSVDADDLLASGLFSDQVGSVKSFFQNAGKKIKTTGANVKQNVKEAANKVAAAAQKPLHTVNRLNPATVALRLGVLTGMKTNLFGIAEKLRYAYLSDQEAARRGLNMKRHKRYKILREKLEKIFFSAGGKPENLKEAILTGNGNKNREVALSGFSHSLGTVNDQMQLIAILGEDLYYDEKADSLNGLNGELGVATAAVVSAASGVLATIGAILKTIGDIKQGGEPGADPAMEALENRTSEEQSTEPDMVSSDATDEGTFEEQTKAQMQKETEQRAVTEKGAASSGEPPPPEEKKGWADRMKAFWEDYKTPILIVGGTAVAAGAVWLALKYMGKGNEKPVKSTKKAALNGLPRKKGQKSKTGSKILRKLKMKPLR